MSLATTPPGLQDRPARQTFRQRQRHVQRRWAGKAIALAERLWPDYEAQRAEAATADSWLKADNDLPSLPNDQWAPDYKALQEVSASAYIRVAIAEMTQCLYVEGHIPSQGHQAGADLGSPRRAYSEVWSRIWQANGMDGRQVAVHRSAMAHGVSYVVAERARMAFSNEETISLRGVSAMSGCALWRVGEQREFPELFIEVREDQDESGEVMHVVKVFDDENVYQLYRYAQGSPSSQDEWVAIDYHAHGATVCPVVAFCNDEDLDGNVQGEISPVIPILKRIDQDTFDRLIVQRFGSWRIRTATGIDIPEDAAGQSRLERTLAVNSLLATNQKDAKFGTLDPTDLDGYIAAKDADLRDFASIMQVPPHHILGLSPNVSAEGLVEAQASLMRKMEERQHLFGESWERVMRLSAFMLGMADAASDFEAQVVWRDMESRSLAQVADALGKLSQMLEVPAEMLWNRIPNWTQQDTELALQLLEQQRLEEELMMAMEAEVNAGPGDTQTAGRAREALSDAEQRRINRMRGGYGPDWDGDGKPN